MQTATPIETVEAAKAEFMRAVDRLKKNLDATPDDKIHWSPAPSARTSLQQVAHCANSIVGMMEWLKGNPFDMSDMVKLDQEWRAAEKELSTRELAIGRLDENTAAYIQYLDSLTPEQVNSVFNSPMGDFPMASAITFPADHLRAHASQMDYIQTCYGDMVWHM